jgi:urease accessory protein
VDSPGSVVRLPRARRDAAVRLERARGEARVVFGSSGGRSHLVDLYQSGAAKVRFPRGPADHATEAVLLNTAGGMTGGDRLAFSVTVGEGAGAIATTQAAERIYRRTAGAAEVTSRLAVGDGGRLDWLPQETIVFDGSALARSLEADLAPDATLLAAETIVLGRTAMGETIRDCAIRDSWRIRRAGRLVFADNLRIDGDAVAVMGGLATGAGGAAFATLVLTGPDAEAHADRSHAALEDAPAEGGVSAWNGMLVARLVARSGQALRATLVRLVETLRAQPMPRVWNC